MITVTETRYLDGTGDVPKDVDYIKGNEYAVLAGDNAGDLVIYHKTDVNNVLAYYRSGYYSKITLK